MENQKFVTVEDFQKYTEYVKGVLSNVKESANSDNSEIVEKLVKYTEHIAEKVNQVSDYAEYLSENLDKSISFSDYLAENVNQIKSYTSYLAEELDNTIQYSEHVAEKADQGIAYSEHLAEKVDQGIQYTEHVAEKADQGIAYSNYLSENLERSVEYSEYIAERVDQGIAYSEHLAEGLEKSIKYTEYIAENVNAKGSAGLNESINPVITQVTESVATAKAYNESIEEKLQQLINKASNKQVSEMHFMNFLSESRKNEFKSLSTEKQTLIVESMNAKPIMSTNQAENIWESAFIEKKRELNFVNDMPEKYISKWSALSDSRQSQIIAESKFHSLTTPYTINNFWATRDLRPTQVELETLNESKTAGEQTKTVEATLSVNESFATDLIKRVKFNLGR